MRLSIKNIGKIKNAAVEINGITVIAGENDTGKSTVGKALFALFNSFYNFKQQIEAERVSSVEKNLMLRLVLMSDNLTYSNYKSLSQNIIKEFKNKTISKESFENLLYQYMGNNISFEDKYINDTISHIQDVIKVPDEDVLRTILEKRFNYEFNQQICNIYSYEEGAIRLFIKEKELAVSLSGNQIKNVSNPENISLHTEAIYIDDPFVLDESGNFGRAVFTENIDHRQQLINKLSSGNQKNNVVEETIAKEKLNIIYAKLSGIGVGDVVSDKRTEFGYKKPGSDKVLNVRSLSTGLKTFVILKMLLLNGNIEQNGTIILDEPEIHLHPEWQLLFAEIIVLIQKEFGVHILLNTHSPYFLNAIEVYAAKYGVADKCRYYLASLVDESAVIDDVTDNIEKIYCKLASPIQTLENERGRL